jgi:hypothetical protein
MLHGLDRVSVGAHDIRYLVERKVRDRPQQHDRLLGFSELVEGGEGRSVHGGCDRLCLCRGGVFGSWYRSVPASGSLAPLVHESVVGNREDPASEVRLGTFESVDVAGHIVKDFTDHILGLGSAAGTGEPCKLWRNAVVQRSPRPWSAFLRGSKHLREFRPDICHWIIVDENPHKVDPLVPSA